MSERPTPRAFFAGPTAADLALLSAAALLFLFCESKPLAMNDLGIYLAMGREMAEKGGLADVDGFTHTVAGEHFLNGTWGSQWLFFQLWRLGGYGALQMLLTVAVVSSVLLVGWGCRRVSRSPYAIGIGGLFCGWLIWQNLGLRPQLFALPLFAGYALLALSSRPNRKTIPLSAAIVAVWANLHGSFAIAPVLSLLVACGVIWEKWAEGSGAKGLLGAARGDLAAKGEATHHLFAASAALLAGCLNPYGPGIYRYIAENSSSPASRGLSEWDPTNIKEANGVRLFLAAGVFAIYLWRTGLRPAKRDLPPVLAFGFLALTAIRHVVWTGMIWPMAFCRLLGPAREPARPLHRAVSIVAAAFWIPLLIGFSPPARVHGKEGDAALAAFFDDPVCAQYGTCQTPVALTVWAAEHGVTGRLFNSMEWGSFLGWRLSPQAKLFVDVRIWIFPKEVWNDYLDISGAAFGWEEKLDKHGVEWAILDRRFHERLIPWMEKSPHWEKAYEDERGLIFRRRPGSP